MKNKKDNPNATAKSNTVDKLVTERATMTIKIWIAVTMVSSIGSSTLFRSVLTELVSYRS
jgi:hypothetical protein